MNYGTEDIVRQLRLGEDSRWEFKQIAFRGGHPHSPKRDSLANELAAFANGHGGVLLCGVTDARRVAKQLDGREHGDAAGHPQPNIDLCAREDAGGGRARL